MTEINNKRKEAVTVECKRDAVSAEKWRRVNKLILGLQEAIASPSAPRCRNNPCEWCTFLFQR